MIEEMLWTGIRQTWPLFLMMILGLAVVTFLKFYRPTKRRAPVTYPYARRTALFTATEAKFLQALREAFPGFDIFGQVRLEDVISVKRGLERAEHQTARNRIKSRHLDFVLTDPVSTWIVCAIELDDPSHSSPRALRADDFKDKALSAAGIPILRVRVSPTYRASDLRQRVQEITEPARAEARPRPALSKPGPFEEHVSD